MTLHYYAETDSLYVELKSGPGVETAEIREGLYVELDASGDVVGFDIDRASELLDLSRIESVSLPPSQAPTTWTVLLNKCPFPPGRRLGTKALQHQCLTPTMRRIFRGTAGRKSSRRCRFSVPARGGRRAQGGNHDPARDQSDQRSRTRLPEAGMKTSIGCRLVPDAVLWGPCAPGSLSCD